MSKKDPIVGIIMGSKSDWKGVMEHCSEMLEEFGVKHDVRVISAHRTPKRLENLSLKLRKIITKLLLLLPEEQHI